MKRNLTMKVFIYRVILTITTLTCVIGSLYIDVNRKFITLRNNGNMYFQSYNTYKEKINSLLDNSKDKSPLTQLDQEQYEKYNLTIDTKYKNLQGNIVDIYIYIPQKDSSNNDIIICNKKENTYGSIKIGTDLYDNVLRICNEKEGKRIR